MVQSCWILIKLIIIGSNLSRLDQIPQNWFKSIKIAQNCQIWTNFVSIVSFASSLSKFGKILIIFAINSNKVKTITLHAPMETERLFSLVIIKNNSLLSNETYLRLLLFLSAWSTVLIDFCTFLSLREPVPRPPGPNRRKKAFSPRNSANSWKRWK